MTVRSMSLRSAAALGVALALALGGCSTTAPGAPIEVGGTGVISGSPTASPTGKPTHSPDPGEPAFDHDPDTAVIEFTATDAGVGGVRGVERITVYGDGRITRTAGDSFTFQTGRLASDDDVQKLLDRAAELGLLAEPDPGDATISDSGWSDLTFTLADGAVSLHVYAPGHTDGLSGSQQEVRRNFATYVSELTDWSTVEVAEPLTDTAPDRLVLRADRVPPPEVDDDSEPEDSDEYAENAVVWPVDTAVREAFGDDSCWEATGDDAAAVLAAMKDNEQLAEQLSAGSQPWFVIDSGAKVPARLTVRATVGGEPCQAVEPTKELPAPWPGENRRPADSWSVWVGEDAVDRAADDGRFDPDASTRARASHYPLTFSVADVDGSAVVDVVTGPHPGGDRDPAGFSLRVDLTSGKILKLATD